MARRSSYSARLAQRQRALERQARAQQRAVLASVREAERARKAYERAQVAEEKERKQLYLESRQAEVEAMNAKLTADVEGLERLLRATLDVDDYLDFESLRVEPTIPAFQSGSLATPSEAPRLESFLPPAPAGLVKFLPGSKDKYERSVEEARQRFEQANAEHAEQEKSRETALAAAKAAYETAVARIEAQAAAQNQEIDEFRGRFEAGGAEAIVEYFSLVLDASSYPSNFPRTHRMAFVPESEQLVIEYELPGLDVIPTVKQYRYVKARDAVESTDRPVSASASFRSRRTCTAPTGRKPSSATRSASSATRSSTRSASPPSSPAVGFRGPRRRETRWCTSPRRVRPLVQRGSETALSPRKVELPRLRRAAGSVRAAARRAPSFRA